MAVTSSRERDIAKVFASTRKAQGRGVETFWLAGATLMVAWGLAIVGLARVGQVSQDDHVLNVSSVRSAEELKPFLTETVEAANQDAAAHSIFDYIQKNYAQRQRLLANVGALAGVKVAGEHLALRRLKPLLVVRSRREFLREYAIWCSVYLMAFWLVHLAWRARGFRGDPVILPVLQLLTGIGLVLAISLHDPLRDTLEFRKFAIGVVAGCGLLMLPLLRGFQLLWTTRRIYTPLLAAITLFGLLLAFGSGPTGSDARVNLGPFQPVEAIKILLVFFLAGYFGSKWQWLRELRTARLQRLNLPRLSHTLPVMAGVAAPLAVFFLLRDLGPALITGSVFLAMFAAARHRAGLAFAGLAALVGGVALGYHYGTPHTVVERISMWLSPWANSVRGGDQLAHSLWAFATGGATGSGPGLGDPSLIPAGHTDLVLPAIAEEWGFPGVASIGLLFLVLVQRMFRAALRAADETAMFLAFGLGTLIAVEMLLISAGVLGAIPLSGVVSPFLSSGNSAMLANFLILAVILGISSSGRESDAALKKDFGAPVRVAGLIAFVLLASLEGRAAWLQVFHRDDFVARDSHVIEEDGVSRAQLNPRLNSLARAIPRGEILDRSGVPLAATTCAELIAHRNAYEAMGVAVDPACAQAGGRRYPLGPATEHLLGDLRSARNFHATNASLIEHDSNATLQGFRDLHELGQVVRFRHQPTNPAMHAVLARNRNVRTTIDARLQMRVAELLQTKLGPSQKKGAAVVMDPRSGEVLALVSYPLPEAGPEATPDQLLDRARYGEYPPGSTFKLVTAIAALRLDPELRNRNYQCLRLKDGRAGNMVRGFNRPIRDDITDHPHGRLNMEDALAESCNAYFAQLGAYDVGAKALTETAAMLDIQTGDAVELRHLMPMASYGQGPVVVSPFKMARVAATIAADGEMPQGRWLSGDDNQRRDAPRRILNATDAAFLQKAMRRVVVSGTARAAMQGLTVPVAGKTGTAQVETGAPHSWFAGYAPYGLAGKQIALAVVVEHGGYGSDAAAPIARAIVEAARELGIIQGE